MFGDYKWETYREVFNRADTFGRGLSLCGMKPKEKIAIFLDTRAEWMIAIQVSIWFNLFAVHLLICAKDTDAILIFDTRYFAGDDTPIQINLILRQYATIGQINHLLNIKTTDLLWQGFKKKL